MHLSKKEKSKMLFLFAIPFFYLIITRIFPMLYTVYYSSTEYNMIWDKNPTFVGFDTYKSVFSDQSFIRSIFLSLEFAVIAVSVEYILGLSEALLLDYSFRSRHILLGILILPMVLAPSVIGIAWYIMYNDRIGVINFALSAFGIPNQGWLSNPRIALFSVIIADVWQWTPFVFLLISSSLQTISQQLYEAARVDGANIWHIIWYIKLPCLKATALSTILLRFMDAFREYDKVYIMTNGGPGIATDLSTIHVYKSAFKVFDTSSASAMAVILLLFISVLYAICLKTTKDI